MRREIGRIDWVTKLGAQSAGTFASFSSCFALSGLYL